MIKLVLLLIALAALLVLVYVKSSPSAQLKVGALAPAFSLMDQNGQLRQSDEFKGRWLVLYFYPKDNTPGCTKEACRFRDEHSALQKIGAQVVGVSVDSSAAHAGFASQFFRFNLVAHRGNRVHRRADKGDTLGGPRLGGSNDKFVRYTAFRL